jgi:two-component system, sensor histidine kinase
VVIHTDPVLLERLLRNLLDNAIKFTEQGGVRIDAEIEAQTIRIDVSDTGPGIEQEHQARVFEEFFQSHNPEHSRERGLGLGLSIVSRLARVLDAQVTLQSQPGEGTVFSVHLPFSATDSGRTPRSREGHAGLPDFDGVSMLVVDDDRVVCDSLARLLKAWGAQVDAVESAGQALELANERQWRVCLSDLRLQHGEDGLDLAMALRAKMPMLSIIFISGDIEPERIRQATRIGDVLLHKPIDQGTLARHIAQLLHMG